MRNLRKFWISPQRQTFFFSALRACNVCNLMNSTQLGHANCLTVASATLLRLSLSDRHIVLLRSVHSETIRSRRRDVREFNDSNWSVFNQLRSTPGSDVVGKSLFVITNIYAPREGSLIGNLSRDACRSIRTCRRCGLRGHCLRVEVTYNSRPIYRLLISQNEIAWMSAALFVVWSCFIATSTRRREYCKCVSRAYRIPRMKEHNRNVCSALRKIRFQ